MIKKFSTLALGLAITLPSAFAAPTLMVSLQENGFAPITASSSTGLVSIDNLSYDDFQINTVTGIGTPVFNTPELDLQTVNVTSATLTTKHTLTIKLTETGLTGLTNPFTFDNHFTGILNGVISDTVTSYIDPSNTAFGEADELASVVFTKSGSNAFDKIKSGATHNPFSETEVIVAVFGTTSGAADSLNSSALIQSAVPEPTSLALIGAGLLGLAFARKRRSR